jgi:hypothetical protein
MPDKKISVEFKDGKKIVKHPDGSVKEFTKADSEKQKEYLTRMRGDIDRQITHVDEDIVNIEKSKKA